MFFSHIFQLKKSLFPALVYPKPEKGTAFGQSLPALANTGSCLAPRHVLVDSQSRAPGTTLVLGKGSWGKCTPLHQRWTLPCFTARYSLINRSRVFYSTVEAGAQERSSTGSIPQVLRLHSRLARCWVEFNHGNVLGTPPFLGCSEVAQKTG